MASQTSEKYDPGGARQGMSSRDLPSKHLLGKGLAGIGYETQWNEVRYARKDFVGVPPDIFRNEANVLIGVKDHQNVVKTHGMTVDKLSCSLVLEYMDDTVSGLLQKRKDQRRRRTPAGTGSGNQSELSRSTLPIEMPEALYIILQIARGMEFLHEQDISHGDLKTRNILVSYRNDSELSVKSVKVADFGLVRTKRKSTSYVSHQTLMLDMVRWKAPECLDMQLSEAISSVSDSKYSDKKCTGILGVTHSADVYSFAVTCFQILTGEEPYRKRNWEELVVDIVSDKLRPTLLASCPQVLRDLLVSCWGENPHQRPTFSDICKKLERMLTVIICYERQWIIKEHREQWEKDLISDSNSWRPLELGEAISQVFEANVLVNEVKDGHYECFVCDFEVSVGVLGTGFFRAPEILQAIKERNVFPKPEIFSTAADVYGYGMTCYEILTGNIPFEKTYDYDLVLTGNRPILPNYVDDWTCELLSKCWQSDPAARPSTREILNLLSTNSAAIRKRSAAEQLSDLADVKDNVVECQ